MSDFRVEVENRFKHVKRDLLVYQSLDDRYSVVHWPGEDLESHSTVFTIGDGGFLLVTIAPEHAGLHEDKPPCWVRLPSNAGLELTGRDGNRGFIKNGEDLGIVVAEGSPPIVIHTEGRTKVEIGKGPHAWQMKVTAPSSFEAAEFSSFGNVNAESVKTEDDTVTVGDNG